MENKDYTVECNVCKQHYQNWAGSTPCCGSIAYIVDEDGVATENIMLYTLTDGSTRTSD